MKDKNKVTDFLRDNFQICEAFSEYKREYTINKFINSLLSNY